jgi:hypothetical protein
MYHHHKLLDFDNMVNLTIIRICPTTPQLMNIVLLLHDNAQFILKYLVYAS